MAPEKLPGPNRNVAFQPPFFRGVLHFGVGRTNLNFSYFGYPMYCARICPFPYFQIFCCMLYPSMYVYIYVFICESYPSQGQEAIDSVD